MVNKQIKNIITKFQSKPILSFTIVFILLFSIFLSITPLFNQYYARSLRSISKPFISKLINKKKKLNRLVLTSIKKETPYIIQYQIRFFDKVLPNGNIMVKMTEIDTQKEALLPSLFLLSLLLATPINWKRKAWSLLTGFILMNFYLAYKITIELLDNYTQPNLALLDLSGFWHSLVYYSNYFLSVTGFSSSYVIPVIIWVISAIRLSDLDRFKILINR